MEESFPQIQEDLEVTPLVKIRIRKLDRIETTLLEMSMGNSN